MLLNPGPPFRRNIRVYSAAVLLLVLSLLPLAAEAQVPTATTLTVNPSPATAGDVVTLTATVTSGGEFPVTVGTVSFLSGKQVLATVQMVQLPGLTQGTATLKTRFAPGTFELNAEYNANNVFQASQSGPQQLTVTGTEPTITTLTDQADGNNFDFTATVFGFGFPVATGQIMFNDLTDGFDLGNVVLSGQGTSTFQPQQTLAVGNLPIGIAAGDFNGDGIPDLAVTNTNDGTVSVLLGKSDGTFQPQQVYSTGLYPIGIAVGDFNRDGILDLVVANNHGVTVSVLLGIGDGTFQPQQTYRTGNLPELIATGDFNGDGIPDLAVTNTFDDTVSVLMGKGDGTFQAQQTFAVGDTPQGIATGDFNGDGILDMVVSNSGDDTVSVLLGKGNGTFQPQQTYRVGNFPELIATGDFNGDGVPDLAVTNFYDNTVSVLLGRGDGTFQAQQTYNVGSAPFAVAVGDFNGDGIADLAVTNSADTTVGVLLGKGDGSFQPQQTYAVSGDYGIAVADFNGDGVPDVATADVDVNTASILLGGTAITAQLSNVPIIGSGIHNIQSNYVPDAPSIYAASASNTVMVPGGGKATPSITLTASPPTVNYGINVTFTALVQSPGGGTPTGTVNFMEGSNLLGTASLVANAGGQGSVASYINNTLIVGTHYVTATYNGDSNFNSATSAPPVQVQVLTAIILTGQPPTNNSGTVSPGGSIQFQVVVTGVAWQEHPLIWAAMSYQCPAGTGGITITCSITCPAAPGPPPTITDPCVLTGATGNVATVTVQTSVAAHLVWPLHRGGQRRVVATLMGLGGIGLVGLVLLPFKLRRKAVGGVLFLVIIVLCFGTSCGTSFAPGITSPPVNNTFYISVTAKLREENLQASTGYTELGEATYLYTLLIK